MKYSEDGSRLLPKRSMVCRILGHSWHREAAQFYSVYECTRCQCEEYSDGSIRERISHQLWWWGYCFRERVSGPLRSWWRCNDCGLRFGRHDDNHDHLPF